MALALCCSSVLHICAAREARHNHFLQIAKTTKTDKVTTHHYEHLYDKYLEPIKGEKLQFMEIGLGCDMNYGPGESLKVPLFFPIAEQLRANVRDAWEQITAFHAHVSASGACVPRSCSPCPSCGK